MSLKLSVFPDANQAALEKAIQTWCELKLQLPANLRVKLGVGTPMTSDEVLFETVFKLPRVAKQYETWNEALSKLVKTKFGGRDGLMIVFPPGSLAQSEGSSDIRVVNRPQAFVMTNTLKSVKETKDTLGVWLVLQHQRENGQLWLFTCMFWTLSPAEKMKLPSPFWTGVDSELSRKAVQPLQSMKTYYARRTGNSEREVDAQAAQPVAIAAADHTRFQEADENILQEARQKGPWVIFPTLPTVQWL